MTAETIATFTRKIAASNRTGLVCVLYEIYFVYETEALDFLEEQKTGDVTDYTKAVRQCGQVVRHLKEALDFSYDISYSLYALYDYVERTLARAMYEQKADTIHAAGNVMRHLQDSFVQLAKEDASAPLMGNTQQVTAGLTYGKGKLNESMGNMEINRGFFA